MVSMRIPPGVRVRPPDPGRDRGASLIRASRGSVAIHAYACFMSTELIIYSDFV
jgi:hypothetical protein